MKAKWHYNIREKIVYKLNQKRCEKERMNEMNKNEFLGKLNQKVKQIRIIQDEQTGNIDELKEKLIPIILEEFIESVPNELRRGNKVKVQSMGFKIEKGRGNIYYIVYSDNKIKVGNWLNGLRILEKEIVAELSVLVQHEVKSSLDNDKLKFYFCCEYNHILKIE